MYLNMISFVLFFFQSVYLDLNNEIFSRKDYGKFFLTLYWYSSQIVTKKYFTLCSTKE